MGKYSPNGMTDEKTLYTNLEIKNLDNSEIEITAELPAEHLSVYRSKALKKLGENAKIDAKFGDSSCGGSIQPSCRMQHRAGKPQNQPGRPLSAVCQRCADRS